MNGTSGAPRKSPQAFVIVPTKTVPMPSVLSPAVTVTTFLRINVGIRPRVES